MTLHRFTAFFFLLSSCIVFAQKPERASGTFQLRIETNMTEDQAREKARELAMINAIQNAFGTYVDQETNVKVINGRESYSIIGNTKVLGEWIETIDEKFLENTKSVKENGQDAFENWITCTITGKVRAATPKAIIKYQPLNCPELYCRKTEFYSNESLYLYFESPVDGYLSVFLEDENEVYRLFPYSTMKGNEQSTAEVQADEGYILFSNERDKNKYGGNAEEYELFTTKPEEINTLYIVFSEKNYVKPGLSTVQTIEMNGQSMQLPKSLSKRDFQQWLATNRAYDQSFLVAKVNLSIISR